MGLTIHYSIEAPADWPKATIRAKLEAARQYAKSLPVVSVSDLAEFQGKDADFQHIREMGLEESDEFFWAKLVHHTPNGYGQATIQKGRYLSHRKGYAGAFGLLTLRDRMQYELFFRFHGSAAEAEKVFANPEFQADLTSLITGETHITPAATGIWASFCKTQFANDPRCGGWANFAKCHLSVLALLEYLQEIGFKVEVRDEGGFWEKRDFAELGKVLGDYDVMLAGLGGAIKDAAKAKGMTAETAMDGRGDREQLEAKAQEGEVGEMLKKLKLG